MCLLIGPVHNGIVSHILHLLGLVNVNVLADRAKRPAMQISLCVMRAPTASAPPCMRQPTLATVSPYEYLQRSGMMPTYLMSIVLTFM